ncbi:DUF2125 domain-containing protein [Faecalibacterium duncaniae]
MHHPALGSRLQRLCALGGRAHHRRRGREGSGRICADERLKTKTPLSGLTDAGEGRSGSGETAFTAWAQEERAAGRRAACPGVAIGGHPSKHNVEIRSFDKILLLIYTGMHIHMQKSRIEDRKYRHADSG